MQTVEHIKGTKLPCGTRIVSVVLNYPRFIHPEMLTHRVFSRNTASSRAIPSLKYINQDKYIPEFTKLKKGMASNEPIKHKLLAKLIWMFHAFVSKWSVFFLYKLKVHKQHANRLLEPHIYIKALYTFNADDLKHFIDLRYSEEAQPEIKLVAKHLLNAVYGLKFETNVIHLPFNSDDIVENVAMAARISYNKFKGRDNHALFKKLFQQKHMSPFEHIVISKYNPEIKKYQFWENNINNYVCTNPTLSDKLVTFRHVMEKQPELYELL